MMETSFSNTSNYSSSLDVYDNGHQSETEVVFFLFLAFAVGAIVRHFLKNTPLPYTVILIVIGLIIGALPKWEKLKFMQDYLTIAQMDPHLMLNIFLPTLIFESAFVVDVHTFKKTIVQSITLAGPGLLISTFLTSLMARFIFTYTWSWVVALMFGTIMSATDPVAVVSLLKDLGASKQLGVIIEGESLLNDGAAIVLFNVFKDELIPNHGRNGLEIFTYFVQVAVGGPVFGYFMAKVTIFWLSRVYNDALVEIAITLASTYVTFYIGEQLLKVSGVLAVVTLGIEINSRKANISPGVEVFLHRFWEVLGYLANTLIFILVGVVISQRAFQDVQSRDWIFVITLYFGSMIIRLIANGTLFPILTRVGYSVTWKDIIIITWGGLRGAVGLALALVVAQTKSIHFDLIGSKILFHTAGIVILTLVINATTTKYMLKALGLSDISAARCKTMSSAVTRVTDEKRRAVSMLKSDRFLGDADWSIVAKIAKINDPYKHLHSQEYTKSGALAGKSLNKHHCPQCEIEVPRVPNPKELSELSEEIRHMMVKAEKISYWRQFEHGMLSREAVRVLINHADTVLDTRDRLISLTDLATHWKIPKIFVKIRGWINYASERKSSSHNTSPPSIILKGIHDVALHPIFKWTLVGIIIANVICNIIELTINNAKAILILDIFNYYFCAAYLIEAVIKIIGLRLDYWRSKWNIFDFIILIMSFLEIIVQLSITEKSLKFSPSVLEFIKIALKITRVARVLRLLKLVCFPKMIKLMDYFVNRRLRFGYDIGRGFVVGVEELVQKSDRLVVVHRELAEGLIKRAKATRLDVIRSMALIRKEHPGIALSVKTHQATRSVLNHCQDVIQQIISNGMLDEIDANKLLKVTETKIKLLENTPPSLPLPDPETIFRNLVWLNGLDEEVVSSLRSCVKVLQHDSEDYIITQGDTANGVFIIIYGLVKVIISTNEDNTVIDFFGAGTLVGEMAVLSGEGRSASIVCETDVQTFYINASDLCTILNEYPVLEERLWRIYGIRVAITALAKLPLYLEWSSKRLLLMCESSYLVTTTEFSPTPVFDITDEYKHVILISGTVQCADTRELLTAPIVVPKTSRHLLLNTGSHKLLVITDHMMTGVTAMRESESQESMSSESKITADKIWQITKRTCQYIMSNTASFLMAIYRMRNCNIVIPVDSSQNTADSNDIEDGVSTQDGAPHQLNSKFGVGKESLHSNETVPVEREMTVNVNNDLLHEDGTTDSK